MRDSRVARNLQVQEEAEGRVVPLLAPPFYVLGRKLHGTQAYLFLSWFLSVF